MNIDTILDYIFLAAIIASAIVGIAKPKANSFWWKIIKILTYISIFNPRNVKVISLDEYGKDKDSKDADNDN